MAPKTNVFSVTNTRMVSLFGKIFECFAIDLLHQNFSEKDKKGLEICACRGVEEIKYCEKCSMLEVDCAEFELEDACAQYETQCSGLV